MKQLLLFLIVISFCVQGCDKKTEVNRTFSDAQKEFLNTCRNEHKLPVKLFPTGNTLWIYLPMNESLINYSGAKRNETPSTKKQFLVSTLEGDFKESSYRFLLDITDGIKTTKDPGYKSDATEEFIKKRLLLYGTIAESFFDLEDPTPYSSPSLKAGAPSDDPDDKSQNGNPSSQSPDFFVVVIADIKNGLAYKSIFNFNDYKLFRSEVLPFEEYNMREINEFYGDANLITDETGKSLNIQPIEWSWFLIEQIKNRVNFKLTRSDFPPKGDIVIEIASTIADTFRYYQHVDYQSVLLKDLREKKTYQFDRPQIMTFEQPMKSIRPPNIRMRYLVPTQ